MKRGRHLRILAACFLVAIVLASMIGTVTPVKSFPISPTTPGYPPWSGGSYAIGAPYAGRGDTWGGIDGDFYVYSQNVGSQYLRVEFVCAIANLSYRPGGLGWMLSAGYYQYGSGTAYMFYGVRQGGGSTTYYKGKALSKGTYHHVTIRAWGGGQWGVFCDGLMVKQLNIPYAAALGTNGDNAVTCVFTSRLNATGQAYSKYRNVSSFDAWSNQWVPWTSTFVAGVYMNCEAYSSGGSRYIRTWA